MMPTPLSQEQGAGVVEQGFLSRMAIAGSGPVAAQAIMVLSLPFLFRTYHPEQFGTWAVVQALAVALGGLVTLRYDLAVVLEPDTPSAGRLFSGVLGGVAGFFIIAVLCVVIAQPQLTAAGLALEQALLGLVWLALVAASAMCQAWVMRGGRFAAVSLSQFLNAAVTVSVQLSGGAVFQDAIWLVAGSAAGQAAAVICLVLGVASCAERPSWRAPEAPSMTTLLMRHARFPMFSLPFTALSLLRERAPVLALAALAGPAAVGLYSQAWRLVNLPAGLVGGALRPVFFHQAAVGGPASIGPRMDTMVRLLLLAGAPWLGLFAFGHETIFAFLLGGNWTAAAGLASVLAVPALLFTISNWMDRILDAGGRQDLNLWAEAVAGVGSFAVLASMLFFGANLLQATLAQSAVLAGAYVIVVIVVYRVTRQPVRRLLSAAGLALALAILGWAVPWLLSGALGRGPGIPIVAGIVAAAIANATTAFGMRKSLK